MSKINLPEHALATVETNAEEQCRWVCSCGSRGIFVGDIKTTSGDVVFTGDERANGAHKIHKELSEDAVRPKGWDE